MNTCSAVWLTKTLQSQGERTEGKKRNPHTFWFMHRGAKCHNMRPKVQDCTSNCTLQQTINLHYQVECPVVLCLASCLPDGDTFAVLHHLVHVLHLIPLFCQQLISSVAGVIVGSALQPLCDSWRLMLTPLLLHLHSNTIAGSTTTCYCPTCVCILWKCNSTLQPLCGITSSCLRLSSSICSNTIAGSVTLCLYEVDLWQIIKI